MKTTYFYHDIRWIVSFGLFFSTLYTSYGQVNAYTFVQSAGTYTPITGGTVYGNTTSDDQRFIDPSKPLGQTTPLTGIGLPIGFNFIYNGTVYDVLAINNNGWISLGSSLLTPSVNITSTSSYTPLGSSSVATPTHLRNRIAALATDFAAQTGSELRMQTIGTAPNRTCVVQWTKYKRFGSAGTGQNMNFQVRLNETSNTVQVVFGAMTWNSTSSTAQIGLGGTVNTDFNNRTTTTNWNTTSGGGSNTASCTFNTNVTIPVSGTTFTWFPIACTPPDLTNLNPSQGAINSNILLQGTGLSNIISVKFNSISSTFNIDNSNQITAVVPAGATNGEVIVINSNGCSDTLSGFQVVNQVCATPTSNPAPGTYGPPPTISLSTSTSNATIYYTTNGTLPGPDNASSKVYIAPLPISVPSVTIKARAFRNGFVQSAPFSGVFTVTNVCSPVTISPATGTYFGSTQVTLSCPTPGVTMYYSTTGNVPVPGTTFTRVYTGPFFVSSSVSIRAIATRTEYIQSPVALSNLTITTLGTLPPVVFSPPAGTYATSPTLSLSCPTEGTTIYYTTNGNTPVPGTSFTQIYTGPFTQFSSGTIKAYAAKAGYTNSFVGTAAYVVSNPLLVATPVFSPLPGVCSNPCQVAITCATPGAQIWYTTTGNTPDPTSPISRLYGSPIVLTKTTTLKARAFLSGYLPSSTVTGVFSIAAARTAFFEEVPENEDGDLILYPNPGSGLSTLSGLPEEGEVTIRIWNAEGRQVGFMERDLDRGSVEIDIRNHASGLYHVEVLWENSRKQLRLIKQ
jgi:hypothetical protein